MKERIEYVRISSFPDQEAQVWKLTYYVGTTLENNKEIPIGTAVLDGVARPPKAKVKKFDGFITDWLRAKQCKIVGHGVEYFNFVSPPARRKRKAKTLETTKFPLLEELKKQEEEVARKLLEENYDLKAKEESKK